MIGFTEGLLQPILQVVYLIFVKGMLVIINALYQIFNFITGKDFIGNMFGSTSSGSFIMDWNSPISILFLTTLVAGLIILVIMIGLTLMQNLFKTREEKNQVSISNKFKYIFYFLGCIIGVPVIFLALNAITLVISSILGVSNSLRVDKNLINITNTYLIPELSKLQGITNITIAGSDINSYFDKLISELNAISKIANDNGNFTLVNSINSIILQINNCKTGVNEIGNIQNQIADIISNMKEGVIDSVAADKLSGLINQLNDFRNNIINLNYSLSELLINYKSSLTESANQLITAFNDSLETGNPLWTYFNEKGIINLLINGNNQFDGLFIIRSYLAGYKDFDLVLEIYRLANNDPYATNWQANPSYVSYDSLAIGILASLVSVILLTLYLLYVCKRIFIIAIYFVISPIIIITGIRDDGVIAGAFARTLVVKFSSIIFIAIGMQVALILTTGQYGIQNIINSWDTTRIIRLVTNVVFIIAALLAGYTTTASINKMLGDDNSIMESIQDVMLLTRGMSMAAAPLTLTTKAMLGAATKGASAFSKIVPITAAQKASVYSSRLKDLHNLGKTSATINDVKNYRDYRSARSSSLK